MGVSAGGTGPSSILAINSKLHPFFGASPSAVVSVSRLTARISTRDQQMRSSGPAAVERIRFAVLYVVVY